MKNQVSIPIKYKGFYFRPYTNALVLNSFDFEAASNIMKADRIKHLELNPNYFHGIDLSFIQYFSFINELTIISGALSNASCIENLSELKKLTIEHEINGHIDYSKLSKLKECTIRWGITGSDSIFKCKDLEKLCIFHYTSSDLHQFVNLKKLTDLSLLNGKISSLDGIEELLQISSFDASSCSKLEDISAISSILKLEILRFDYCKKIKNIDQLKYLKNLKELSINDLGNIQSLDFIEGKSNLEYLCFVGDVNIVDGNLNYVYKLYKNAKLKKVLFKNKKHYSHKNEDLGYVVNPALEKLFNKKK